MARQLPRHLYIASRLLSPYLIDPDELNQFPLPSVSKLHLYAMCEVERVLVEGKKRAVSVDRKKFAVPGKLSYLGSCTYWSKYRRCA